jgi:hypothetical protein
MKEVGLPRPSPIIIDLVKSWLQYDFGNLDTLDDRGLRESLLLFLLAHYLKTKSLQCMCPSMFEVAAGRLNKLCSMLSQQQRTPVCFLEISEMAWPAQHSKY